MDDDLGVLGTKCLMATALCGVGLKFRRRIMDWMQTLALN